MGFVVEHDGGQTEFPQETLLVFVDETGHEEFADPAAPFFGFAGCVCPVPLYGSTIDKPWSEVESKFPNQVRPLHAADLKPKEMTEEQLDCISSFFKNNVFGRFAAVASNKVENETQDHVVHLLARLTCERILKISKYIRGEFEQVVMIFEHSQRTDSLIREYFPRYRFCKKNGAELPTFFCTQTKKDEIVRGLTVADFIAHTAGVSVRARLNGRLDFRRDFEDVFHPSNRNLASFFEVTRASGVD